MTPVEHAEALALSMVARGEGTHPVEGHPGVQEAVVKFSTEELGSVEVTLRGEGKPLHQFRFGIAAPEAARPAPPERPVESGARPTDADVVRLRQLTELTPDDASAWNDLGGALRGLGRPEEAIAALEKAVALQPGNPFYRLELGMAYGESGRYADAEKCHSEVAAIDPELKRWPSHPGVIALIKLAHARWKQGQAVRALEALRPAIPLVAGILRDLGAYSMDAGKHLDAVKFFSAAGGIAPTMADVLHNAGRSLVWIGRFDEAVPWLINAVRVDASCTGAWHDLGHALARLGRRAEARRMLRSALKRDPKRASSWYELGCLDALDGKRDAAFRTLRRAAQCGYNRVAHVQVDPDLAGLRKDKRWPALVAAMQQAGSGTQPGAPPPF